MSVAGLTAIAKQLDLPGATGLRKQDLIFQILRARSERNGLMFSEGVLETLPDGYGFLRAPDYNYLPGPDDVYVSPSQIRRFDLHTGDTVSGQIRPPDEGERYFALVKVDAVNFEPPERKRERVFFENLTPLYPAGEVPARVRARRTAARACIDLMAPIGKGQRGLIVAPPRTGKTMLLQALANSIMAQPSRGVPHRAAHRRAAGRGHRHAAVGEGRGHLVDLRRAAAAPRPGGRDGHREGEAPRRDRPRRGHPARLDHAPGPGLQHGRAGVRPHPVRRRRQQRPAEAQAVLRRGAQDRGGGSLTIIATALVDTGSRMDEVIFEEFKGTGNLEIHLDRKLADRRVFPSIDIQKSGTRKEELLLDKDILSKVWVLRKVLDPLSPVDAMELLLGKMAKTKTNAEFLNAMNR